MKQNKLLKVLGVLSPDKTAASFKVFDESVSKLKEQLKESIHTNTLDEVNSTLDKFKSRIDLNPIIDAVDGIREDLYNEVQSLESAISEKTATLESLISNTSKENLSSVDIKISSLNKEIQALQKSLESSVSTKTTELKTVGNSISSITAAQTQLAGLLKGITTTIDSNEKSMSQSDKELNAQISALENKLEQSQKDLINRLNRIGGGSANRKISFNSIDYLTRYTDINYKAGANVTFTIVNNDQTKQVDVTVASSGGGGGSVRVISSVSVDTTAGSASGTDYVYLVSGTTTITLPTAVGNTNLYTVKNVGTGVVSVVTLLGQTIDNDTSVIMPVRYTSVDIISDTANWNIT